MDGNDAIAFREDYGRNQFLNPCTQADPCNGDFDCDGDVDGGDAAVFKDDFGRGPLLDPCPPCRLECSY